MMKFLTVCRLRKRWTRAELARNALLHPTTVGLIESGRLLPYPTQLEKLATALGLSASQGGALLQEVTADLLAHRPKSEAK